MRIYLDNEHYVTSWQALERLMLELADALERIAQVKCGRW